MKIHVSYIRRHWWSLNSLQVKYTRNSSTSYWKTRLIAEKAFQTYLSRLLKNIWNFIFGPQCARAEKNSLKKWYSNVFSAHTKKTIDFHLGIYVIDTDYSSDVYVFRLCFKVIFPHRWVFLWMSKCINTFTHAQTTAFKW